jgi:hypothetical protein
MTWRQHASKYVSLGLLPSSCFRCWKTLQALNQLLSFLLLVKEERINVWSVSWTTYNTTSYSCFVFFVTVVGGERGIRTIWPGSQYPIFCVKWNHSTCLCLISEASFYIIFQFASRWYEILRLCQFQRNMCSILINCKPSKIKHHQ